MVNPLKILTLFFVLITTFCVAQKKYAFDYLTEYEMSFKKDSTIEKIFYLNNSKDNSYIARVSEIDSLNYRIIFRDHKTFTSSNVIILKSDFFKAEFFNIDCKDVFNSETIYKGKEQKYNFFKINDTLVNNQNYSVYQLKRNMNSRKTKRTKIGSNIYLMYTTNSDFLPMFFYPPAYKIWENQNSIIPNGVYFKKLFVNYLNKIEEEESFVDQIKIDKKIIITGNCN